jgi:hypothetical protein
LEYFRREPIAPFEKGKMGFLFLYPEPRSMDPTANDVPMDMLDNLIFVTIVLFILSVITEKLTQLIRMYPLQFRIVGLVLCFLFFIPLYHATKNVSAGDPPAPQKTVITTRSELDSASIKGSAVEQDKTSAATAIITEKSAESPGGAYERTLTVFEVGALYLIDVILIILLLAHTPMAEGSKISSVSKIFKTLNHVNKTTDASDDVKEREVTTLSFIVGFVVAYSFNANLFHLFSAHQPDFGRSESSPFLEVPNESFYALNPQYFGFDFLPAIGFLLTAFFLAFGSKFFHDMLDTLFLAKNLRRKVRDDATYDVGSSKELEEWLKVTDKEAVSLAIAQNEALLKTRFSNISYLNDSIALIDNERQSVVAIYLNDNDPADIPSKIPVTLPSGKKVFVATEIIGNAGLAAVTLGFEGPLANVKCPGYKGSVCCVVTDKNKNTLLLTNGHVLSEGRLEDHDFRVPKDDVDYDGALAGTWHYGSMDKSGDFGLVLLDDPENWVTNNDHQSFKGIRDVTLADVLTLKVKARGHTSKIKSGYILDIVKDKTGILYKFGKSIIFNTVILVGDTIDKGTSRPITSPGDSGGALYDENSNLIGIITGSNEKFTYVIPVNDFVKNLNLNLK